MRILWNSPPGFMWSNAHLSHVPTDAAFVVGFPVPQPSGCVPAVADKSPAWHPGYYTRGDAFVASVGIVKGLFPAGARGKWLLKDQQAIQGLDWARKSAWASLWASFCASYTACCSRSWLSALHFP